MKLTMKFCLQLNFEIYFLSFPWEISFWCYFSQSWK